MRSRQNGPLERHTHHKADSTGGERVACHIPKIELAIGDVNVRSQTFRFVPPSATDCLKIPNPCTTCHTTQSTAWAEAALKTWPEFSPWRVP